MGCDIHYFVEKYSTDIIYDGPKDISEERDIRVNSVLDNVEIQPRWITADKWKFVDNSYWEVINEYYGDRNYYLFTVLAGVRGSSPTISEPRGVPEDASIAYREILKSWDSDAHSRSYFTLKELLDVDWSKYDKDDWLDDFHQTIERMKLIDPDPNNVRCVFFFDN